MIWRDFRTALLALMGVSIGLLAVLTWRTLHAELERRALREQELASIELERLERQFIRVAERTAKAGIASAKDAFEAGLWQIRCLQVATSCQSDPDGLVAFSVVYSSDGERDYPPSETSEMTFLERAAWRRIERSVAQALELSNAGASGADTVAERGLGPVGSWIVQIGEDWLTCGLVVDTPMGSRLICALLDGGVFRQKITEALRGEHPFEKTSGRHLQFGAFEEPIGITSAPQSGSDISATRIFSPPFSGVLAKSYRPVDNAGRIVWASGLFALFVSGVLLTLMLAVSVYRKHSNCLRMAEEKAIRAAELSHELRTPLTNIRLYAGFVSAQSGEKDLNEARRIIVSEVDWLDGLVERTLSLVRQGEDHSATAVLPDEVVNAVCQRFEPLLLSEEKSLKLTLGFRNSGRVDRWPLEQVLINMFDNVRRHGSRGKVIVATGPLDGGYLLHVENELVSEVCCLDRRDEQVQPSRIAGMGIGICREILDSYGGKYETSTEDNRHVARAWFRVH